MPIDRRSVLAASAASAMLPMTAGAVAATGEKPWGSEQSKPQRGRVVTLEEHYYATALADQIPRLRQGSSVMDAPLKKRLTDLGDSRLRDMDESGITMQVLSATWPGADVLDGEEGIRFARNTNDFLAERVRRYPNRFAGFAHLPMRSPEAAADELERAVTQLGFRGALINGTTQDRFLDDPRFAPILARAEKLDVPIYIHPNLPPKAVFDIYYAGLPAPHDRLLALGGYGWHSEVGIHVFRLALSGAFDKYPRLKVIVGHMGEMMPFILDRMDYSGREFGHLDFDVSKTVLDHVYITTSGVFSTAAFLCALTTFGADRILFSVDYPYSSAVPAMRWFDSVPITPDDRIKMLHGNADRILKLTPTT